jgi:hypothetical protein
VGVFIISDAAIVGQPFSTGVLTPARALEYYSSPDFFIVSVEVFYGTFFYYTTEYYKLIQRFFPNMREARSIK